MIMDYDKTGIVGLLIEMGVPRNEAITYAALYALESVSIRKVAEATGINRGTTYEALKSLVGRGLVSVRQSGKREYYTAESPEKIYDIIREKRRELLEVATSAKAIVPDLLAQKVSPEGRPLVRYYEGDEGVATVLKDVLQTCRSLPRAHYHAYSSSLMRQYIYRNFPKFTEQRIAEGIHVQVIAVGEGGEVAAASERKWLSPGDRGNVSSYILIYGAKVAVISISKDNTPYGVVTEDAGTASMQRLLFEQLWNRL
jgi:sugar-specific transcriptional regulator TrmB